MNLMTKMIDNITGVVVCYNTQSLLKVCLQSIRKFYPYLKIIIIDGSSVSNSCHQYVKSIKDPHIKTISLGFNIGHGKGMNKGINMANTDYVLPFDSDITLKKSPLEKMIELFKYNTFGVGEIQYVNTKGINISPVNKNAISYLHPYFQIINRNIYKNFSPYNHHGAPCILTMLDIHKKGLSEKILRDFPVKNFIEHRWRGTRELKPKEFFREWINVNNVITT